MRLILLFSILFSLNVIAMEDPCRDTRVPQTVTLTPPTNGFMQYQQLPQASQEPPSWAADDTTCGCTNREIAVMQAGGFVGCLLLVPKLGVPALATAGAYGMMAAARYAYERNHPHDQ